VQEGKVFASAWLDRKMVMVMSTNSQPSMGTMLHRKADGSRQQIPCPQAIMSYNQHMGGVDFGDQLQGYYKC